MADGVTIAAIAGLTVGIATIIVFATIFNSPSNSSPSATSGNLRLTVEGLKGSYHAGEPITFTLRVTGYGNCYQTPNAAIWNASAAFASIPIWRSGLPSQTCDSNSQQQSVHAIDDLYSWGEERTITINKAGDYIFGARVGENPVAQKEFKVTG